MVKPPYQDLAYKVSMTPSSVAGIECTVILRGGFIAAAAAEKEVTPGWLAINDVGGLEEVTSLSFKAIRENEAVQSGQPIEQNILGFAAIKVFDSICDSEISWQLELTSEHVGITPLGLTREILDQHSRLLRPYRPLDAGSAGSVVNWTTWDSIYSANGDTLFIFAEVNFAEANFGDAFNSPVVVNTIKVSPVVDGSPLDPVLIYTTSSY